MGAGGAAPSFLTSELYNIEPIKTKIMHKISLRMAIFSHLSDVQEMIYFKNQEENIRMRVNFVKMLVTKLDEGVKEMSEDELNAIWTECNEKFGKKG